MASNSNSNSNREDEAQPENPTIQPPHQSMKPETDASSGPSALPFRPPEPSHFTTTTTPSPPLPPVASASDANLIHVPNHSRWFSWDSVHDCEIRFLPEFFDSSSTKNPRVYMYYRNSIVKQYRDNPSKKITFTDVRRTLVGDVGSIRRVFDFLESWGLINYTPSSKSLFLKSEDKEIKPSTNITTPTATANTQAQPISSDSSSFAPNTKRLCSGCKSLCSIACFACDKYDLTLCARCYVRGNYRVGINSSEFKRVEINEESKTEWTDRETLQLLEAVLHYGEDWKKVAQHVGNRTEKDCVSHFIKLPFGEQFLHSPETVMLKNVHNPSKDQTESDTESGVKITDSLASTKRLRLTPLADSSNPIMAQAAFLSALAGAQVAQTSAQAALAALTEGHQATVGHQSLGRDSILQEIMSTNGVVASGNSFKGAHVDANIQLEKEVSDMERAMAHIIEVQMKDIQNDVAHYEELDWQIEKEWQQLEQIKNILFIDQRMLLTSRSTKRIDEQKEVKNVNVD